MSNHEKSYDDEDEEINKYYNNENEDVEKDDKKKEKATQGKHINNEHYDMVYDVNESVENLNDITNTKPPIKNEKEKTEEEEEEEEDEFYDRGPVNSYQPAISNTVKELPKFDITEFYNIQNINPDVKELLTIMSKFKPNENKIDTKMKPFIPNFIPCIGEVDAFLKINRPDNQLEELGLSCLDEPTINGVDPVIFSLDLSYTGKNKNINPNLIIKTVDNAEKKPKEIQSWIDSISELHQKKMSSNVSYSKNMPDVESLMQVWPEKLENLFKDLKFPDGNIALSTENYAKTICNMLDVPIHKLNDERSLIEALHLIFSVYYEFKENQHFPIAAVTGEINSKNVQSMKFD